MSEPATSSWPWVDAHAHLAQAFPDSQSDPELARAIAELKRSGMLQSIQAGVDATDWKRQLEIAQRHPDFVRPVLGLHPWWVKEHSASECELALGELKTLLQLHRGRVAALGELGLDFSKEGKSSEVLQLQVFRSQLQMARDHGLPLVLHLVHAHERALEVLREHAAGKSLQGIVHAFSGSTEVARHYLELGLKLSIGPGVAEPGRFSALKKTLPLLQPGDWVLESDWAGERYFRAVQAASGLTGLGLDVISKGCADALATAGLG